MLVFFPELWCQETREADPADAGTPQRCKVDYARLKKNSTDSFLANKFNRLDL